MKEWFSSVDALVSTGLYKDINIIQKIYYDKNKAHNYEISITNFN